MGPATMLNTMESHKYEIRVAIIGYVSVGKSTVLNALLGNQFSEVSVKRTTAGINLFRVAQPLEVAKDEQLPETSKQQVWNPDIKEADETHDEISQDNKELRSKNVVNEKIFDIKAEYHICDMPRDTQLILIDIPGINEAETSKKYKDYVESKWDTFDCVVVVMDAIQGVNTEEQVQLLHFVKQNNINFKDIPTIVLGNKMDDFYEEDTIQLIRETHSKTVEIFGAVDFQFKHDSIASHTSDTITESNTIFIPLSAKNAFTYRKAGKIDLGELEDSRYRDLVNKIGHDEYGRKWSVFLMEERIEVVSQVLGDPKELEDRLAGTNFQAFLSSLSRVMGNETAHRAIFGNQINTELNRIAKKRTKEKTISASIREIFKLLEPSGRTDKDHNIYNAFWEAFDECECKAFESLEEDVNPNVFERLFLELEEYHGLAFELGWSKESQKAIMRMQKLLGQQLSMLCQKIDGWCFRSFCMEVGANLKPANKKEQRHCGHCNRSYNPYGCGLVFEMSAVSYTSGKSDSAYKGYRACANWQEAVYWPSTMWNIPTKTTWNNLSPQDWITILSSLSLLWNQMVFIEEFGPVKVRLDRKLSWLRNSFEPESATFNSFTKLPLINPNISNEETLLVSTYCDALERLGEKNGAIMKVKMPDEIDNPDHWGFLAWKYVKFSANLGSSQATSGRLTKK